MSKITEKLKKLGEKWANEILSAKQESEMLAEVMEDLPELLGKAEELEKACAKMRDVLQEKMRIAIAKACGWQFESFYGHAPEWRSPNGSFNKPIPDYLNDLNAMHEAENSLSPEKIADYALTLCDMLHVPDFDSEFCVPQWPAINATATQRAEAFLRALNQWEES